MSKCNCEKDCPFSCDKYGDACQSCKSAPKPTGKCHLTDSADNDTTFRCVDGTVVNTDLGPITCPGNISTPHGNATCVYTADKEQMDKNLPYVITLIAVWIIAILLMIFVKSTVVRIIVPILAVVVTAACIGMIVANQKTTKN